MKRIWGPHPIDIMGCVAAAVVTLLVMLLLLAITGAAWFSIFGTWLILSPLKNPRVVFGIFIFGTLGFAFYFGWRQSNGHYYP